MRKSTLSYLFGASLLLVPAAAQSTVTTIYTGGNSLNSPSSVQFNATVLNSNGIVITGFDVNCENTRNGPIGSVFDIHVYVTAIGGTYLGNQTNAAVWTKIAEGSGVSQMLGTPTPVDTSDFFLPAGQFGIALQFVIPVGQLGTAYAYTNGNGTNQQFADTNLQLDLGSSCTGLFAGPVYNPRVFNGAVHYEAGTNAAYGPYGVGCSGGSPLGAPTLLPAVGTAGQPRLGTVWQQEVGNLGVTPGVGILVIGQSFGVWGPWSLPLDLGSFGMPGCNAYVAPDVTDLFVHAGTGTHTLYNGLPAVPGFAGIVLGTQALVLDPAATNPLGASITNLTAGRIGN